MMQFHFDKIGVPKTRTRTTLNCEDFIVEWLGNLPDGTVIGSHDIQDTTRQWILNIYGKTFNADTLNRKFRGIRNDKKYMLDNAGIILNEFNTKSRETKWQVSFTTT